MLQQLAADPSDELLASRIVSLLQDIPDGEYKVDQLLAAAQMLLAVSPRLGLICAHAAFRSAPSRLESLAIAEEALEKMGRRAKVQVLRQERKRLEDEAVPTIELTAIVSQFLLNEESTPTVLPGMDLVAQGLNGELDVQLDATVVIQKNSGSSLSPDMKANHGIWRSLGSCDDISFNAAMERATHISRMTNDEALLDAVDKVAGTPGLSLAIARMIVFMVVDALLTIDPLLPVLVEQPHEVSTGIMARLLAWHDGDVSQVATAVRDSVAIRVKRLPSALQEGLNRVLREQIRSGRPTPTFLTTTL